MEDENKNLSNAKLAYSIIESLLEGNEALSDLLVLMAHTIDQDVTKALTATAEWENYLAARRKMDNTKIQIELFTSELRKIDNE